MIRIGQETKKNPPYGNEESFEVCMLCDLPARRGAAREGAAVNPLGGYAVCFLVGLLLGACVGFFQLGLVGLVVAMALSLCASYWVLQ